MKTKHNKSSHMDVKTAVRFRRQCLKRYVAQIVVYGRNA
jgi:hypothetical protein